VTDGLSHAAELAVQIAGARLVYGLRLAALSRRALADALGHIRKADGGIVKLVYFQHDPPNFGDEINRILWPRLLPEGFSTGTRTSFSSARGRSSRQRPDLPGLKHVAGSGYGGYSAPPDLRDGSWNVLWLRGPLTAATAGRGPGPRDLRQPRSCCARSRLPEPAPSTGIAFMPHFESATRGDWARSAPRPGSPISTRAAMSTG
jgi:hypothetical protein